MSLIKLIQFWRQYMVIKKEGMGKRVPISELQFEVIPVEEDPVLFRARKEEVQILLTRIVLSLHRRGRPKKEEKEESYAA